MDASNKDALHMATAPQPSINFHARIDIDTEERRRRLQAQTGLSAPRLVGEAFRELERRLCRRKTPPISTADSGATQFASCKDRRSGIERHIIHSPDADATGLPRKPAIERLKTAT